MIMKIDKIDSLSEMVDIVTSIDMINLSLTEHIFMIDTKYGVVQVQILLGVDYTVILLLNQITGYPEILHFDCKQAKECGVDEFIKKLIVRSKSLIEAGINKRKEV